ncbi:MAG: ribbon-helix-helix domain-containing protein [Gemmiger sp.]|nr:ribbon-helix-helix domain-containing protein [Gemmiger sp.]
MATDKARYTVSVDEEMFQAIEDFRFKNRYQTRSEATVKLISLGLEQLEKEQAALEQAQKNKLPGTPQK